MSEERRVTGTKWRVGGHYNTLVTAEFDKFFLRAGPGLVLAKKRCNDRGSIRENTHGCSSIWLTAGTKSEFSKSRVKNLIEKLETPDWADLKLNRFASFHFRST
jgi:hypothetical protein